MSEIQAALRAGPQGFPFRSELSLVPLIAFGTRTSGDGPPARAALARVVAEQLEKAPELLEPIHDVAVLERHRGLVDVLMSAVFAPGSWEQQYGAAMLPFHLRGFYATPPARRLFITADGTLQGRLNVDERKLNLIRLLHAYALILRRVYGFELDIDYPFVVTIDDPDTGLDRHFREMLDTQFVEVEAVGAPPELTEAARRRIRANAFDVEVLGGLLPADRFVFRGVTILKAIEVTDQEVLSALKRDLIDRESIVSGARFMDLQDKLRTLFRRPDLKFALAAITGERVLILNSGSRHEHACIFADSAHHRKSDYIGSIYARAVMENQPIIVEDLATLPSRTRIEDEILQRGVRNIMCAPLRYQDRVIGTLELGSPKPGDLDASHLPKLYEVLPLFAMAVQRSMEELNARIQTQMKEAFTAIHPVVEWRFRKAILDSLDHSEDGGHEMEPIVFDQVYPLYALSDIRGSSTQRVLSTQADLLAQLRLARQVIEAALATRPLPGLDELRYRLDREIARVGHDLGSGDEATVVAFLRQDVEQLFDHLAGFGAAARERIDAYRAALDPRRGAVYQQRQVFEESVTRLTDTISSYLQLEAQTAQGVFPHYFEKQKTDGVDHQIYVGASLVEDGHFDLLYLKSLRLWQLMVVCGVAARADQLVGSLPVPLHTTHLVLAQHTPLSISFRFDEKRFDVEGAYDVRYEIVKKRIDKAVIRGTAERVTQPSRIAIVYSQPEEGMEYRGYVEYLQHLGYLGPEVEDLELEELQGVSGLRALRVTVALKVIDDRPRVPGQLTAGATGTN
jgi:GAF domain-containing protein